MKEAEARLKLIEKKERKAFSRAAAAFMKRKLGSKGLLKPAKRATIIIRS